MSSVQSENTVNTLIEVARNLIVYDIPKRIALMDKVLFEPMTKLDLPFDPESFQLTVCQHSPNCELYNIDDVKTINALVHSLMKSIKPMLYEFIGHMNAIRTWIFHLHANVAKNEIELQREEDNLRIIKDMIENVREDIIQIGLYFLQRGILIAQFTHEELHTNKYCAQLIRFDDKKYTEVYNMLPNVRRNYAMVLTMLSEDPIISDLVVMPNV